ENPESEFIARVDAVKRRNTANNHSATHLLHAALRQVLGSHVEQKGSLVNADYLRFDFAHFKGMSPEEIREVEQIVNEKIRENIALDEQRAVPLEQARQMGAMALFGEKYGDEVRAITVDPSFSRELCGGTHVPATGQIGLFKITSESAVAAGVRRIEAITATGALNYVEEMETQVHSLKELLKSKDLNKSVERLLSEKAELEKKLEQLESEKTQQLKNTLKQQVETQDGFQLLVARVDIPSADQLKKLSFQLRNEVENLACVLGTELNGKPMLSIIFADDLVGQKGWPAGKLVKELTAESRGCGGGQPFYATAGGNDLNGMNVALQKAKQVLK